MFEAREIEKFERARVEEANVPLFPATNIAAPAIGFASGGSPISLPLYISILYRPFYRLFAFPFRLCASPRFPLFTTQTPTHQHARLALPQTATRRD